LRRFHLFEFNDAAWVPGWLREFETDYLRGVLEMVRPFDRLAPHIADALRRSGLNRIVDLCSGAGGPLPSLQVRLAEDHDLEVSALLTDRFPSRSAGGRLGGGDGPELRYRADPVDAMDVPRDLVGMRTIFDALHHFPPEQARRVLADARSAGVPLGSFEVVQRTLPALLASVLIPIFVLLLTPALRPFSVRRLLLTYLVPVLPLLIWWDGFVSNLRSYTPAELEALTRGLAGEDYIWEVGQLGSPLNRVTYLLGQPTRAGTARER
jgi:hypothetical protein